MSSYKIQDSNLFKKMIKLFSCITDTIYMICYSDKLILYKKSAVDKYAMYFEIIEKKHQNHITILYQIDIFNLLCITQKLHVNSPIQITIDEKELRLEQITKQNKIQWTITILPVNDTIDFDRYFEIDHSTIYKLDIQNLYDIINKIRHIDNTTLHIHITNELLSIYFYHLNYYGNIQKKISNHQVLDIKFDIDKDIFLKVLKMYQMNSIAKYYCYLENNIIDVSNENYSFKFLF